MAAFYAGFPGIVYMPIRTVNWQFSSGLQAVADVAASMKAGFYDIARGIGAGLESMTIDKIEGFAQVRDCLLPMGITTENVAHGYGVARQEQDHAAVEPPRKAAAATAAGKFEEEIIPVSTKVVDSKTGEEKLVRISMDDGIGRKTSMLYPSKLKPTFEKDGSTAAGIRFYQ